MLFGVSHGAPSDKNSIWCNPFLVLEASFGEKRGTSWALSPLLFVHFWQFLHIPESLRSMLNAHAAVGPALSRLESTSAQNWASALQCRSQARSNVRYGSGREELQKEK